MTMTFWLAVAVAAAAVGLIRYSRADTYSMGIVSLLDLLFSIKRRARRVQSKTPEWTMADTIEGSCRKYWDRCFVEMAGHRDQFQVDAHAHRPSSELGKQRMTFGEAEMASSAVAKWVTTTGLRCRPGDIVAIFMRSGCEFVTALFGLIRCGVRAALVNTELRGNSLAHALGPALPTGVRAVLVSPDLRPALESLREAGQLPASVAIVECGHGRDLDPWTETTRFAYLRRRPHPRHKTARWDDTCIYIYTSGTTGFPKASKMNHMRLWSAGCVGRKVCRLRSSDRLYCPLPLYHSSGLLLGLGACLQRGCTTVVRARFSVRHFSRDILAHRCTGVQYIGEMARYLVAAPANALDANVRLRFAWGNGMPVEAWTTFQRRYNVGLIHEFYASTEGNVNLFNNTGMAPGACGVIPPGFDWIYPVGIFRHDVETGELTRDDRTGLCVPAGPNEPGELLGLIKQHDPSRRFDGYADEAATRSKVASDVCRPGDSYFRSGDVLRRDRRGFLYFCDRVGDTFRWKGENASASEVARAMLTGTADNATGASYFLEAVVYGVVVKGHPGRAGMATAVLRRSEGRNESASESGDREGEWQNSLWDSLQLELPRYAQPLFVRITTEIEKTSTQKYKKKKLQDESFFECGADLVYFRDDSVESFVIMDDAIKDNILTGKQRV